MCRLDATQDIMCLIFRKQSLDDLCLAVKHSA